MRRAMAARAGANGRGGSPKRLLGLHWLNLQPVNLQQAAGSARCRRVLLPEASPLPLAPPQIATHKLRLPAKTHAKNYRDACKMWNQQDRAWVDIRLHESHDEGGFGVPNSAVTRHVASYTTNARFFAFLGTFAFPAQQVWLPGNDHQDPATWTAPPLCQLKRMHEDLLQHYDCTDQPAAAQQAPPSGAGGSAAATRAQTRSLSLRAPRTTATSNSSSRNSTSSTRHSSGVRFSPQRLPALRTSSPLGPGPFRRNAVSRSSSPRNGPSTRPYASATRARVLRSSASSTCLRSKGHGPGIHSPRGNEWAAGASRPRQGPRPLLEAPFMARDHQAHFSKRCLGPSAVDDVCLHDARFGGSRALLPPRRNNSPLAYVRLQKTLHGLSRRPHSHMHSSLRCKQGARLDGGRAGAVVPHGRTHGPHAARRNGKRRTARRRGDPQLPPRRSWPPEPGLRPVHHARALRLK
jgi:hypothetical protein